MKVAQTPPTTTDHSESIPGAPLESILCTSELDRRPSRPADTRAERAALDHLTQRLAESPRNILQALADTILAALRCDSAGVSLVNEDRSRFYWPAIAGVWRPHIAGGTPRNFGPCGDVLEHDCPLLFRHFERRYTYFMPVTPPCNECLLVPFYVGGEAVGTIWAITHDAPHHDNSRVRSSGPGASKPGCFDREDLRLLQSLGGFASGAYEAWISLVPPAQRPGEKRPG